MPSGQRIRTLRWVGRQLEKEKHAADGESGSRTQWSEDDLYFIWGIRELGEE